MKFAEQQSTSSMIKCLLFRLFSIHYNGSINSPTRCFLLIQHRPMFHESKKKQYDVLTTRNPPFKGTYDRKYMKKEMIVLNDT